MNTGGKKLTDKEILLNLFDLMFEAGCESGEDSESFLREQGVDVEALVKEGMSLVGDYKRELRLSRAKKKKEGFEALLHMLRSLPSPTAVREKIRDKLLPSDPERQLVFNRRLEKITDADLKSLENEKELLELWSEFSTSKPEET